MTISATSQGLKPGVCTSSNRPANPFDGMMIYETDTNLVRIWNGSAWKTLAYSDYTSGSVIQTVSATKTDSFSTTSTTFVDITGVSVSITPTSTTSNILIWANGVAGNTVSSEIACINLVRGSTNIAQSTGSGTANQTVSINTASTSANSGFAFSFLDSPSTTSATTYKLQARTVTGGTVLIGRFAANDNFRSVTSITVMEIAG